VCTVEVDFGSSRVKRFLSPIYKATVLVDTGSPASFLVIPRDQWDSNFYRDNQHAIFFDHSVGPAEKHDLLKIQAVPVSVENVRVRADMHLNLSMGRIVGDQREPCMYGHDGIFGLDFLQHCTLVMRSEKTAR
jgi:hypothetical protein